jgi:hypothetical protein
MTSMDRGMKANGAQTRKNQTCQRCTWQFRNEQSKLDINRDQATNNKHTKLPNDGMEGSKEASSMNTAKPKAVTVKSMPLSTPIGQSKTKCRIKETLSVGLHKCNPADSDSNSTTSIAAPLTQLDPVCAEFSPTADVCLREV